MRGLRDLRTGLLLAGWLCLVPAALPLLCAPAAQAQPRGTKRLILKDGSYQVITKYQVHGDRVRFYSAEREDWEEIPNELIDWDATNKWNQDHIPGQKPPVPPQSQQAQSQQATDQDQRSAAEIDREVAAAKAEQAARTPLVAPGLHLPDRDGIFVLDYFQGIPELVHLDQTSGNVNRDASHNVLRAALGSFRGAQEPVRIDGQAARVRIHDNEPALYVSLDTDNSADVAPDSALMVDTHGANSAPDKNSYSSPDSRYVIIRVDVRPGERVIGALRINRVGDIHQSENIIPTRAEVLPGKHWMKITPRVPLDIGEYAMMEILAPGMVNLDVWDFGISPNAPENRHPITPIKDQ